MLLPIFNELGRTDESLAFVPQRRISVFSLFLVCLLTSMDESPRRFAVSPSGGLENTHERSNAPSFTINFCGLSVFAESLVHVSPFNRISTHVKHTVHYYRCDGLPPHPHSSCSPCTCSCSCSCSLSSK